MKILSSKQEDTDLLEGVFKRTYFLILLTMASMMGCVVVDSIITGRFLGKEAVTAMGIVTPLTAIVEVIMSLFATGCSQICVRTMGKGNIKKVNSIFSTLTSCTFVLCLSVSAIVFIFAPKIAWMLAPEAEPELLNLTAQYMRGYAFMIVPGGLSMNVNLLLNLDNDQKRCLYYAVMLLLSDIVLDLLNVLVFHMGIFGMGLTTSLSNLLGLIVLLLHFRQKDHVLHFSTKNLDFSCVNEALHIGIARNLSILVSSVYSFVINNLLIHIGGSWRVASFTVCNSLYSMSAPVFTGLMMATTAIMSLSFGEHNEHDLEKILRLSFKYIFRIGNVMLILFFIFADGLANLFLESHHMNELIQAGRFIRFYAVMMMFSRFSYPIIGSLMATDKFNLSILLSILKEGVYPTLFALACGLTFGVLGVEIGFVLSGILTFMTCFAISWIKNRKFPKSVKDLLLLPESFDIDPSNLLEATMTSAEDVEKVSENAAKFCLANNQTEKIADYVSLFIEEMGSNTVRYGFEGKRAGRIELRILLKPNHRNISLRDNGDAFDPMKWLKVHNNTLGQDDGLGIRMIVGLAEEVLYFRTMGLNTLQVALDKVKL